LTTFKELGVSEQILKSLEEMGFEIEASHHENAPGQHEIDWKYANAVEACDNIQTFKLVVKTIARKHGLHATFMPKPLTGECGSGMHFNMSLFNENGNAFYDEQDKIGLSETAYRFMAGILKHAKAYTAVCNPVVNSYKRLIPGYEAPVYIAWSAKNRSPLVRIPSSRGLSTRIELRSVDPSANPYLALAVLIKSGLDGIEHHRENPEPINHNIFEMSRKERDEKGVLDLPSTLHNALKYLEEDEIVQSGLGSHIYNSFLSVKKREWAEYSQEVSVWEKDRYFKIL